MYCVYLFDKAFRVFADQTTVAHVLKYFTGKGIALRFQLLQISREFFIHGSLYPIPDMHIDIFENTVIGLFADQTPVLILPAFPAGLCIEDPVSFFNTSPCDLCQEPFAQLSRPTHDDEERSRKKNR